MEVKMSKLSQEQLISIADELYREQNPNGTICTPNSVYITVLEKWYPKYLEKHRAIDFKVWVNETYGGQDE
jgi:hypothetical protein